MTVWVGNARYRERQHTRRARSGGRRRGDPDAEPTLWRVTARGRRGVRAALLAPAATAFPTSSLGLSQVRARSVEC